MKSSQTSNSDRYKEEEEEDGEREEINEERAGDSEEDEYGEEIIDLGDDVQPFSMQFKLDKPIMEKQEKTTPVAAPKSDPY